MITVTKYHIGGRVLASTKVRTYGDAVVFLNLLDDQGNLSIPTRAVSLPARPMFNAPFHDQDDDRNSDAQSGRLTNLPHGE